MFGNKGRISRRDVLKWMGMTGVTVYMSGCGQAAPAPTPVPPTSAPASAAIPTAAQAAAPPPTPTPQPTPAPKKQEPVTISFTALGKNATETQIFKDTVAAFEKANQDVKVDFRPWPSGPAMSWARILAMFAAGTATDVIRLDDDAIFAQGMSGQLLELDPYIQKYNMNRNDYYPETWQHLAVKGKQYTFPVALGAVAVYYNVGLFKKEGVPLPPTSWETAWEWDQFVSACKALTKSTKGDGKIDQYAYGISGSEWYMLSYGQGLATYNADETKCILTQPEIVQVAQEFADFVYKNHYAPFPEDNVTQLFNANKLAMFCGAGDAAASLSKDIEWDVCPRPKTKKRAVTKDYHCCFGIPSYTKHPDEAFKLLKFFMEPEAQTLMAKVDWGIPPLKSVAEGPAWLTSGRPPKNRKVWLDSLKYHIIVTQDPMAPTMQEMLNYGPMNVDVRNGKITADEFMKRTCEALDQKIQEAAWKKS